MNLDGVTLVAEDEHAWHVKDSKGPFKIAKHGLGHETAQAIAQHFSGASGKPEDQEVMDTVPADNASDDFKRDLDSQNAQSQQVRDYVSGGSPQTGVMDAPLNPAPGTTQSLVPWPASPQDIAGTVPPAMRAQLEAGKTRANVAAPKKGEAGERGETAGADKSPPPPAAKEAPEKPLHIPSGPNVGPQLDAANKEAVSAQERMAATAQNEAEATGLQQKANAERMAAVSKEWNDKWAANQQRADALSQEIANDRIDANRFWHTKSTGEKLSGAIALVLGGIGSAMTGGPNAAQQIIQSAIERDIEAQKLNLGKKQSLLAHYVQQGHSLMEAGRLAKADAMDAAAAELQRVGTRFMGEKAQNVAGANIADLHKQAAMERQQVYSQGLQNQLNGLKVLETKQALQMAPLMRRVAMESEAGGVLPDDAAGLMDPKRRVKVPGGWTLANTEKDRDEVAETRQAMDNMRGAIKTIRQLSTEVGAGGATTQQGKLALVELQNAYQSLLGRTNAPRGKQEEQLSEALSNPTAFWKTSEGINGLMDQMESIAKKHAASVYSSRLVGGLKSAKGLL